MKKIFRIFVLICLFVFNLGFSLNALPFGDDANKYLEQLTRIQRSAFTQGEVYTADYLGRLLRDMGYDTVFEEIGFPQDVRLNYTQGEYLSHNIIGTKKGSSDLEIIIGAAYDSEEVKGSTGFEGATGVSVLLEVANRIKDIKLPYTVKFILFGSGKPGNIGSTHYVSTRSQDELNKIMYFLNLSSLGSGKDLHIYSNAGNKGFLRDDYLSLAKKLGIKLLTSPAMSDFNIPEGVGYDIGEHVPFKYSNVPYGFMEATSWDTVDERFNLPNDPTGKKVGVIDGSGYNNYAQVMEVFKDRVEQNMANAADLIYNFIVKQGKSIKIVTSLTDENLPKASSIEYTLYKDGEKVSSAKPNESLIVEFKDLEEGNYKVEVTADKSINFLKNIGDFEFDFDSDGEYVFVNDETDTYTYRKEFTENYIDVRNKIQKSQFEIKVKKLIFDYSNAGGNRAQEDPNLDKNDNLIKIFSISLGVLVALYVILKLSFLGSKKNK